MAKKKLNSDAMNEVIKKAKEIKPEESMSAKFIQSQSVEKTKKPMGQPKKYNEPLTNINFKIPVSIFENIKILSDIEGTNQTQFLIGLIKNEVEKKKEEIETIKKMRSN